jgi:PIN domain nuclease of toxin-antitoxin system
VRYLLDTEAFLKFINDDNLGRSARQIIANPQHAIYLSYVSVWEMAIKATINKLTIPPNLVEFVNHHMEVNNFTLLNLKLEYTQRLTTLPLHHKDPWDRMIIAQAFEEKLPIIGSDAIFVQYGVQHIW